MHQAPLPCTVGVNPSPGHDCEQESILYTTSFLLFKTLLGICLYGLEAGSSGTSGSRQTPADSGQRILAATYCFEQHDVFSQNWGCWLQVGGRLKLETVGREDLVQHHKHDTGNVTEEGVREDAPHSLVC